MKCPFCGHQDTQVKDSRPSDDGSAIRRRRSCPNCNGRFTTFERVQLRELVILKRNGRRTPFERDKLERSLGVALRKRPVQAEQIEQMVNRIVRQLESLGETEIPSSTVGDFIMKALKGVDEVAYVRLRLQGFPPYGRLRQIPGRGRFGRWGPGRADRQGLMRVTLKLATSLDGRIATASGESQWITGEAARLEGHRLRAAHDAILVGVETVLHDDPVLTARLPGRSVDQPLRVVLDSRLRTPPTAKLAGENTLILTDAEPRPIGAAQVKQIADDQGRPAVPAVLQALKAAGAKSVLIEGGGQVAASFLRADAVDAMEWFRAPILLGGEGRPCVATLALAKLADAPKFRRLGVEPVGDDLWERYARF